MPTLQEALPDLAAFTGTTSYYRHRVLPVGPGLLLTDGARYVAEKAGAWWLMDKVLAHSRKAMDAGEGFATIKLRVMDGSALFIIEDGNYNQVLTETIEFTDFPTGELMFFLDGRSGGEPVLMLRSEY